MMLKHKVNRLCPHPGCNIAWAPIIGAAAGALLGGKDKASSTTEPWGPVQPYLTGALTENQNLYDLMGPTAPYTGDQLAFLPQGMSSSLQGTIDATQASIPNVMSGVYGSLAGALQGYNPANFVNSASSAPIGPTAYMQASNYPGPTGAAASPSSNKQINYGTSTVIEPFDFDYRTALQSQLYGDATQNPYLQQMAGALGDQTQQQWRDMSTDMWRQLDESLLPQIRRDFNSSGALGSSRQALLQGNATGQMSDALARETGDMNTNLQNALAGLYGGVFEGDQNRKFTLSGQLAGLDSGERVSQAEINQALKTASIQAAAQKAAASIAASASTYNADRDYQLGLAQLGLQAQNQQMDAGRYLAEYSTLPLAMQQQAIGSYAPLLGQEQSAYDLAAKQYYETAQAPYAAFNQYLDPILGIAGQSKSTIENRSGDALGGASAGFNLASLLAGAWNS